MNLNKIKHKLVAALVAATSFFILAIPAFAWDDPGNLGAGHASSWSETDPPFSHIYNYDHMAWRVNMYVSTNADGKINESKDTIGNGLALVGSVLCTSPNYVKSSTWKTYIQTNYTNTTRDQFSSTGATSGTGEDLGMVQYTLPTLQEFEPGAGGYDSYTPYGETKRVVIAKSGLQLFDGQWKIPTEFNKVHTRLTGDDAAAYTTELIEQIMSKDGDFKSDSFSILNLQLKQSILNASKSQNLDPISDFDTIYNEYILPTGSQPMVEWALVLTPLYRFSCNIPFYYYPSSSYSGEVNTYKGLAYFGGVDCVALDAFWMAQYNRTSIALGNNHYYDGLTYKSVGGVIKNVWQYQTIGLLSFFLQSYSGAVGSAAYCTEEKDPYLGVWTNTSATTQDHWYGLLQGMPKEYAKRGGIAVFTTEIETPEAPVYYHTYTYRIDENDKDSLPTGYTKGKTTDDPYLLKFLDELDTPTVSVTEGTLPEGNTFSPKKAFENDKKNLGLNGLVVAAMSPQPSIKQPGAQEEYPLPTSTDYYLERVPDIIDAHIKPTNPLAESAVLKTGKATPETADDPKEFHVKIVHIEVIPEVPVVTGQSLNDRIKSYDVTQLIEDTRKTVEIAKGRYSVIYRLILSPKKVVQNYCFCNNY